MFSSKNKLLITTFNTKTLSAALLAVSMAATSGCSNQSAHEHDHHAAEHAEHDHAEHEHHDTHEGHDEHEGHEHHDEHGEEGHDHHDHHGHDHAMGPAQVIPEGYTVNFAVSNHPIFLLSEAVTEGTNTTVKKLLNAGDVGHHGSLSPSDMKVIEDSKYVVWFGDQLESNLAHELNEADNTVKLLDIDGLVIHPRRDVQAKDINDTLDPHVWLDTQNAKMIVNTLAELHSKANPENATKYKENAENFANDLDALVKEQAKKVSDNNKYWSSHDAFQYIESALNIELAGALTNDHEIPAKASQIAWLIKNRPYDTMCLITQSPARDGIVNKLKPIQTNVLIEDMSDNNSYIEAWKAESQKIVDCLK